MWKEYMGITFKIPKFTDLHYIPKEKFNTFVFILIENTYNLLLAKNKLSDLIEISSLSKTEKDTIYLQTYQRVFYDKLKTDKDNIFSNKLYIETH